MPVATPRKLTPKQAKFVDALLLNPDSPTAAAIHAGISPKFAAVQANKWLKKGNIKSALDEVRRERSIRTGISADRVVNELAVVGFSDIRHYAIDEDYRVVLAEGAPDHAMRAVSSVKHKVREYYRDGELAGKDHEVEYRLWSKTAALNDLGKHTGVLVERHEINITQQHLVALLTLSDLEMGAFLQAMQAKQPEAAMKLLPGGKTA